MNMAYCNIKSRERVLEVIAWSFGCLRCLMQSVFARCVEPCVCLLGNWESHCLGTGVYPTSDPWGTRFSRLYCPERLQLAGTRIAGHFVACLEGIQADQDFVRVVLRPDRTVMALSVLLMRVFVCACFPFWAVSVWPKAFTQNNFVATTVTQCSG